MAPHLAETHTEELVQLCSACWDPGQAYSQINLMQLVGCYESAKQRKRHIFILYHTYLWKTSMNTSLPIWSLSAHVTYIPRKHTHNLSLIVRGRNKLHLLLPVLSCNSSFLPLLLFHCLKPCTYKKTRPHFKAKTVFLHFEIYHQTLAWFIDNNSNASKMLVSLVWTGWRISLETHCTWRRGTTPLK